MPFTPDQEAAREALFAQLPRQAPVFMLGVCRFLDDPLNLKAFAPASAHALECPELRALGVALKQDITACNDNFVLTFEAAWVLSRIVDWDWGLSGSAGRLSQSRPHRPGLRHAHIQRLCLVR